MRRPVPRAWAAAMVVLLVALLAVVVIAANRWAGPSPDGTVATESRAATSEVVPSRSGVFHRSDQLVESDGQAVVEERAVFEEVEQARVAAGIRLPDGTFLPPLNGVTASDPIPRVERESYMPPIGEVVGRYTDDEGYQWWVTADGSAFTTRWVTVRLADGRMARMVRLDQSDSLADDGFALPPTSERSFVRDESK